MTQWVIDQSLPCSNSCFLQNFDCDDDVKKDNDNRRNDEADEGQVELDPGGGGHVNEAGVTVHLAEEDGEGEEDAGYPGEAALEPGPGPRLLLAVGEGPAHGSVSVHRDVDEVKDGNIGENKVKVGPPRTKHSGCNQTETKQLNISA